MVLLIAQALPGGECRERHGHGARHSRESVAQFALIELGDAMLGRQGTLIAAAHAHYRLQLERRPHLAEYFEQGGRGREIAARAG